MDKQAEYLRLLQERNRIRRQMNAKSAEDLHKEEMEKNFSIHFSGANNSNNSNNINGTNVVKKHKNAPTVAVQSKPSAALLALASAADQGKDNKRGWGINPSIDNQNNSSHNINNIMVPEKRGWGNRNQEDASLFSNQEYNHNNSNISIQNNDSDSDSDLNELRSGNNNMNGIDRSLINDLRKSINNESNNNEGSSDATSTNDQNEFEAKQLLTRVNKLSANQKKFLFQMLQSEIDTEDPRAVAVGAEVDVNRTNEIIQENQIENGNNISINSHYKKLNVTDTNITHNMTLKIRIFSNWESGSKSNATSLKAIRLRYVNNNKNTGGKYTNILSHFNAKLVSGMKPLPNTSDSVRLLPLLFGCNIFSSVHGNLSLATASSVTATIANRTKSMGLSLEDTLICWQSSCPVSNDCPIEILIEGDMRSILLANNCIGPDDDVIQELVNIELALWNYNLDDGQSAPAKDIDIYLNNQCIWTGELDNNKSRAINLLEEERNFSSWPLAKKEKHLQDNNPVLQITPWSITRPKSSMTATRILDQKIINNSPNSEIKSKSTSSKKPDWLKLDSQTNNNINNNSNNNNNNNMEILNKESLSPGSQHYETSKTKPSRPSRRQLSLQLSQEDKRENISTPSKLLNKPVVNNNINNDQKLFENDNYFEIHQRNSNNSTPNRDNKRKGIKTLRNYTHGNGKVISSPEVTKTSQIESELDMRKSLEAIQHAEKFNLGRLQNSTSRVTLDERDEEYLDDFDLDDKNAINLPSQSTYRLDSKATTLNLNKNHNRTTPINLVESMVASQNMFADSGIVSNNSEKLDYSDEDNYLVPKPSKSNNNSNNSNNYNHYLNTTSQSDDIDTGSPSQRRKRIDSKIEKVQETIQNSLAGLANIISSLPSSQTDVPLLSSKSAAMRRKSQFHEQPQSPDSGIHVTTVHMNENNFIDNNNNKNNNDNYNNNKAKDTPHETIYDDKRNDNNSNPIPRGKRLVFQVLSTWGDKYYVGLNGIELYDDNGCLLINQSDPLSDNTNNIIKSVIANPDGLHVLPDYEDDPRKGKNLFDGINFTRNDLHIWLAPQLSIVHDSNTNKYNKDELLTADGLPLLATITIIFESEVSLSMIRVYNFNKSRAHNQRGVRRCRMLFDEKVFFDGEIRSASGQLISSDSESHLICFISLKEAELMLANQLPLTTADDSYEAIDEDALAMSRPKTASSSIAITNNITSDNDHSMLRSSLSNSYASFTREVDSMLSQNIMNHDPSRRSVDVLQESNNFINQSNRLQKLRENVTEETSNSNNTYNKSLNNSLSNATIGVPVSNYIRTYNCRRLVIEIENAWDPNASYVGLCGLEVLYSKECLPIIGLSNRNIDANPKDLSSVGFFDDPRVLGNLFNGVNDIAQDEQMWLIPFTKGSPHHIEVDLLKEYEIAGIRLWNYNKSNEDILRGVKNIFIKIYRNNNNNNSDDIPIAIFRCVCRQAPGGLIKYGQTLLFQNFSLFSYSEYESLWSDVINNNKNKSKINNQINYHNNNQKNMTGLSYITPLVKQDYEIVNMPNGLLWKFTFYDNHGDSYYIGLDKIEFYNKNGHIIDMFEQQALISAVPYSLRDIEVIGGEDRKDFLQILSYDNRTPEQLFVLSRQYNHHSETEGLCWLCPLSRSMTISERLACARRLYQENIQNNKNNMIKMGVTDFKAIENNMKLEPNNLLTVMFDIPQSIAAI
eukprot:gene8085-10952_t